MPTRNTRDASNQSRPDNRGGPRQGRGFADMQDDEQGKIATTGGEAVSSDAPDVAAHAASDRPNTSKQGEDPAWLSANGNRDVQDGSGGGKPRSSKQPGRDYKH